MGSISHGHILLFESLYSRLATCPLSHQDRFSKTPALYPSPWSELTHSLLTHQVWVLSLVSYQPSYSSSFSPLDSCDPIDQSPDAPPNSPGILLPFSFASRECLSLHASKPHQSFKYYCTVEKPEPECRRKCKVSFDIRGSSI